MLQTFLTYLLHIADKGLTLCNNIVYMYSMFISFCLLYVVRDTTTYNDKVKVSFSNKNFPYRRE